MLGIVDYGGGNVFSVARAFEAIGEEPVPVSTPEAIGEADRLVLPGVGAAAAVREALRARGIDGALRETVVDRGRPMLGICVGMQILARRLHEFGETEGLGWVDGDVRNIREAGAPRSPHMGWNTISAADAPPAFRRTLDGKSFYFCHSYAVDGAAKDDIAAMTEYGGDLTAALAFGTVLATQFHPEKSQINGQRLLEAFVDWTP
jgi:glutamine amidotransferase